MRGTSCCFGLYFIVIKCSFMYKMNIELRVGRDFCFLGFDI